MALSGSARGAVVVSLLDQFSMSPEQAQQSLEFAAVAWGGVELEGKSASIKSISDSTQSSKACCLSSSILLRSAAGSRRQLSIRKNERMRERDEPGAPLLLEGDDVAGEVDLVIGGEQCNQSHHDASDALKHSWRFNRATAWPGLHRRAGGQSRSSERQSSSAVHTYHPCQADASPASRRRAAPAAPTPTPRP